MNRSLEGLSPASASRSKLPEYLRARRSGPLRMVVRFCLIKPLGGFGLLVILMMAIAAVFAPWLAPYDPMELIPGAALASPSVQWWFGGDQIGRDVLSRIIYGARISLYVGIAAVGIGTTLGTVIGVVAGYLGGKVDLVVQRFIDAFMSIPSLILALVIVAMLGQSVNNVILAVAVGMIAGSSRVIRSAVISIKENAYVEAARAIGCKSRRIALYHVLPNVAAPILIVASVGLGSAILSESSLSFLGMGAPPNVPAWGQMLSGGGRSYFQKAPWIAIFPGLAISLAVLAFNMLGDALRDVLDPRLRGGK